MRVSHFAGAVAVLASAGCASRQSAAPTKQSSAHPSRPASGTRHVKQRLTPRSKPLTAEEAARGLAVLTWHRIAEHPAQYTVTTPAKFAQELALLHDAGANVMRIEDAVQRVKNNVPLPPRAVALCFDDGFKTCYTQAYPLLKHYHWPGTLYVYPHWISTGGASLSWEQLKEMQASRLVDVQSHTMTHPQLPKLRAKHGQTAEQRLHTELFGSKAVLEQKLGTKVTQLAYPYGYYNKHIMAVAKQAGYDSVWAVKALPFRAHFRKNETWMNLPRYLIYRDDSIEKFARYAFGPLLAVRNQSPKPSSRGSNFQPTISAKLGESVNPRSIKMFFPLGQQVGANYDPKTRILSYTPPAPLGTGEWMAMVSATDKAGHTKVAPWSFTIAQPTPTPAPTRLPLPATAPNMNAAG